MFRINEKAWELVQRSISKADELGWKVDHPSGGTWGIDAGVETRVGYRSGFHLAKISTAGLAKVGSHLYDLAGIPWPYIEITCDHPYLGCFVSQAAHWPVNMGEAKGMGSGPACLKGLASQFAGEGLSDPSDCAVLLLETSHLPAESSRRMLAESCGVRPDRFALLAFRTSSLAGSVTIAARSTETALHKLRQLGFDLKHVRSSMGICPAASPTGSDLLSMGKINDVMFYGSRVWLLVEDVSEAELKRLVDQVPASTSPIYGKPFLDILEENGGFYNIDPGLFAPAEITCIHAESGKVYSAGKVDDGRLKSVLLGDRDE